MIEIIQARTPEQIDEARRIFREYETWLDLDLCFQNFEDELRTLPGKYAPPDGRLFLAYFDAQLAGCIAMRKLADNVCEMKRLFVRGEFRGRNIGPMLIEKLLLEARQARYEKMRLDTFPPKMKKAVELYKLHGFYEIPPYYDNPHEGVLYLEKDLRI
jgi:ribosomal protein S18 acetylase RimI-like enzyme